MSRVSWPPLVFDSLLRNTKQFAIPDDILFGRRLNGVSDAEKGNLVAKAQGRKATGLRNLYSMTAGPPGCYAVHNAYAPVRVHSPLPLLFAGLGCLPGLANGRLSQ